MFVTSLRERRSSVLRCSAAAEGSAWYGVVYGTIDLDAQGNRGCNVEQAKNGREGLAMKLSVVVICWNDRRVIADCLRSIFEQTYGIEFEVIVSDNGSEDGSVAFIRENYPAVRILENGGNLGFAKGNNVGIAAARGEYILILNPDTIIHDGAINKLVAFAEKHSEAGAFGCRVLNRDGSYQHPARPLPTILGLLTAALGQRWLGYFSEVFLVDRYMRWAGRTVRTIGYQSGCCVMFTGEVLRRLGGFDERFFYHFEETDLCRRVSTLGKTIVFCPEAEITHLGGQSVGRFPIRFALETYRSRYRYFFKHQGMRAVVQVRLIAILGISIRYIAFGLQHVVRRTEPLRNRLAMYKVLLRWNIGLDPVVFIRSGKEPDVGYVPLAPPPVMIAENE